ncbi:hypothetical protein [Melittangium boletus]|uniref:hypothetical protein n=1 Tax=Melittangium boletus TaxID=83453 RepID=UPI003DA1F347
MPSLFMPRALMFGGLLLSVGALADAPTARTPWAEPAPVTGPMSVAKPEPAEPAPCQPDNFIPGETAYKAITQEGSPAKLYQLASGELMNINGWSRENARVVTLSAPYALTYYTFGCASQESSVLDFSRDGKRYALYQHVRAFSWFPPKQVFFLDQSERKNGQYQSFVGLLDLKTKKKTPLPALDCVSHGNATFSGERLVTYGEARAAKDNRTAVCVWSLEGKLQGRVYAELDWMAASADLLLDAVGVLPRQPDVVYAIHHERFEEPAVCEVRLQSLTRAGASKRVALGTAESREDCLAEAVPKLGTLRL